MADYLYIQVGSDLLGIQTGLAGTLSVAGSDGLSPTGEEAGGSYLPASVDYTLTNTGTTSINWTASDDAAWVTLSAASGTLAAGASTTVTVSVVAATIDALADGAYSATVTFTNTTNGNGSTTRSVSLTVTPASGGASAFAQYGTTFTLDSASTASGQYVTGDYWYTGARTVTVSRPHSTDGYDGAMVNPGAGTSGQGYRTSLHGTTAYDSTLDKSRSAFTLAADSSLVATVSWVSGDSGAPSPIRPAIRSAAVLTRESSSPAATAFRPNFCGSTKYRFTTADITYANLTGAALPSLSVPSGTRPTLATVEGWFQRPWLDHHNSTGDGEQYWNPTDNMTNYSREHSQRIGIALMYMSMAAGTIGDKTTLRNLLIQQGIDYYGALVAGCKWPANGGHNYGKKALIIFAGALLNDAGMMAIGTNYPPGGGYFPEDSNCFLLDAGDVSRVVDIQGDIAVTTGGTGIVTGTFTRAAGAPASTTYLYGYASLNQALMEVVSGTGLGDVRKISASSQVRGVNINNGDSMTVTPDVAWSTALDATSVIRILGYQAAQKGSYPHRWQGQAEWGIRHVTFENYDNPALYAEYRIAPGGSMGLIALAMKAMGLQTLWANDPFFDYLDWYIDDSGQYVGTERFSGTWSAWSANVWDTHRGSYA